MKESVDDLISRLSDKDRRAIIEGRMGRVLVQNLLGISEWKARRVIRILRKEGPPEPEVSGIKSDSRHSDPEEVKVHAKRIFAQRKELERVRRSNIITFPEGPVLIAFIGDQHIGNEGTDVDRAFREAELVRKTPGAYAIILGDVVDNFIVGYLKSKNFKASLSIMQQWELAREYIQSFGGKLLACISGNHDVWTEMLTGIDYLAHIVPDGILYDRDEMRLTMNVGRYRYRLWLRHKWRGTSIYNQTHGQERAARFADSRFHVYAGAHIHVGGLYREFIHNGERKVSVQVGTYKIYDDYARSEGFAQTDHSTAVGVIFDEHGGIFGGSSLRALCDYMDALYGL